MSELSLDDQLKQAQVEKTRAEARKADKEADAAKTQARSAFWSEAIKVFGGVVLGIGGVVVAYTQYEVGELKAAAAKKDLAQVEEDRAIAKSAQLTAEAAVSAAVARRDIAVREQQEAEVAIKELKASLTQSTKELNAAKPESARTRLAYIQFRGDLQRSLIDELRTNLKSSSFETPGAERVVGDYQNLVKYFSATESTDAEQLAKAAEAFFAGKGCPLKFRVVPATTLNKNPPLEVWLSHSCKK